MVVLRNSAIELVAKGKKPFFLSSCVLNHTQSKSHLRITLSVTYSSIIILEQQRTSSAATLILINFLFGAILLYYTYNFNI